ncbi:MAG: hypothetical protein A4E56_03258 [Pelotomaculum sp. PtaU1.Bin065]|nr:MAG: hypothetical protein A4E56_03258 [Pelotomaculum sp. PtaU1.Bin065]
MISLENKADFFPAEPAKGGLSLRGKPFAREKNVAGCGSVQSAQQVQQGGFTAPGGAGQRYKLPSPDCQVSNVQHFYREISFPVNLGQVFNRNQYVWLHQGKPSKL